MGDKSSRKYPDCTPTCFNFLRKIIPLILKNKNTDRLPLEIESNILQRIPAEPLLGLQSVCKRWRDEINNPYFIKSHTGKFNANSMSLILFGYGELQCNLYSLNYHNSTLEFKKLAGHDSNVVGGCCNGLVCFRKFVDHRSTVRFSLHNPITGTIMNNIPHLVVPNYQNYHEELVVFGYDCINDDYKIFYSVQHNNNDDNNNEDNDNNRDTTWLYSLKRNSWKSIKPLPRGYSCGISNNMSSYWLIRKPDYTYHGVSGFDFESEEYHDVIPMPDDDDQGGYILYKLVDLRGCLHLVKYTLECTMDVWVLKKNRSWVKLIHRLSLKQALESDELVPNRFLGSISVIVYCPPLPYAYSEDGSEILIGLGQYIMAFVRYDLRTGELKPVVMSGEPPHDWVRVKNALRGMPWTGSLVSISNSSS
ncbi:F-box/kelch-repeat protein At3g23880-like [Spinacia oleracea]|uniref:F-box/kelch-repeat protein At3g23880-like n=1 Tax=Spinacia oleracea TaxID=3562 RepID=A0A9R0IRZ1_SPIOL|nr:F-box/kelch-repeat protein At3g23880-like [Spinacia oleracea]